MTHVLSNTLKCFFFLLSIIHFHLIIYTRLKFQVLSTWYTHHNDISFFMIFNKVFYLMEPFLRFISPYVPCATPYYYNVFFMSFSVILVDVFTIVSAFAPGFTIPWTSKPCPRLCCTSWAHPFA